MKSRGQSSAVAVAGAFDKIDVKTPTGLQEALDIITQVSIRSPQAGEAIRSELVAALAKLDGTDLREFQENVTEGFSDTTQNAKTLAAALSGALQASLSKLGLTAQEAGTQFTENGAKIVSAFTDIANNAQASGTQIQLAFAKALSQTSTTGEVDALKQQLQDAFDQGKISASQFDTAMAATGRKLAELQVAAVKAGAELDGMGQDGTTAAQRISAALQDTRDKLVVQANQIAGAINNALSAGDHAQADALRAQFKGVDAQLQSLNNQLNTTGNTAQKTADDAATAGDVVAAANFNAGLQANIAADKTAAATKAAEEGYTNWGDAADGAALATQGISADTSNANKALNDLSNAATDAFQKFQAVSQAAGDAFTKIGLDIGQHLEEAFGPGGDTDGFAAAYNAIAVAGQKVQTQIDNQRASLQGEIALINTLGQDGSTSFGKFGNSAEEAAKNMFNLSNLIATGQYDAGLLGQQELQPLQAALDAARQRAQGLVDATKQANEQIADLNSQLLDQIDEINGDQKAQENRSYEKQKQQILDLEATADASGKRQAQEALKNLDIVHQANLKKIADEANAQISANQKVAASNGQSSGGGSASGVAPDLHPITINISGGQSASVYATPDHADNLRNMMQELAYGKANSI